MSTNPTQSSSAKLVITSLAQYADLAKRYPGLLNYTSFGIIKDVIQRINSRGCKCNSKSDLSTYRPQFDAALAMLTATEQTQMKALLQKDKICYYTRDVGGRLRENCF